MDHINDSLLLFAIKKGHLEIFKALVKNCKMHLHYGCYYTW